MRYAKSISDNRLEATVLTEDGGVVSIHHNGDFMVSTYHHVRTDVFGPEMWDALEEGKQSIKDWRKKQEVDDDMIHEALAWLCPTERDWVEEDYYLFTTEFNHQQNKRRANL